jgi:hypothetical protein
MKKTETPLRVPVGSTAAYGFRESYFSTMASVAQTSEHAPHSEHASASITYFPSPSLMAPEAHSSKQEPQLMQSSVIIYIAQNLLLLNFKNTISECSAKGKRYN